MPAKVHTIGLHPNVAAFLRLIQTTEGTAKYQNPYRVLVGGGSFDSYQDHPNKLVRLSPSLSSTAAGAYQFLKRTWDTLGLPDFSPKNQDLGAIILLKRRGAYELVKQGRFQEAIKKCNREWASLPGSPYGQPTFSMVKSLAILAAQKITVVTKYALPIVCIPLLFFSAYFLIKAKK